MITRIKQTAARLWKDEAGTETLEYALIIGLILIGTIAIITAVGTKALARWSSLNRSM